MDDGRDKVEDLFVDVAQTLPNIRYIRKDEKMRIGAKRNAMNSEARGAIIIAMDDDDYYPPDRVATVVKAFKRKPNIQLAGSSEMYMYYTDTKQICITGPFGSNHATNGTMAWRKTYSDKHKYNEFVTHAEESSYLDNYSNPIIQLNPLSTIMVICHKDNTVDKNTLREQHKNAPTNTARFRVSSYKLEDIVKNPKLLEFYRSLSSPTTA